MTDRRSQLVRGLLRNDMLVALVNQALISGMTFVTGIGVARYLGIAEFGRLALVLILQLFTQSLQGCYIVSPMMSLSGTRSGRSQHYYAAVMTWSAILALVAGLSVTVMVVLIYGIRDGQIPWNLALAAGAMTITQNMLYCVRRMLFAKGSGRQALLTDTARYAGYVFLLIILWLGSRAIDVATVLWVLAATGLITIVPLWRKVAGARIETRLLQTVSGRHHPLAKWLALMLLLTFGQEQAIALGLGAALSDEALGGLRAGQYLIGTTHFIWVALENFVPTSAGRAYAAGGLPAMRAVLWRTMMMFGTIVWGVILLVSIPAEFSLQLAFGPGYEQFAPILRIYGLTYAIAFWREVWVFYFYPIERTEIIFRAFAFGFAAAVIVFYPALKLMGITGAAITVLVANAVSTAAVMYYAWKGLDREPKPIAARPA